VNASSIQPALVDKGMDFLAKYTAFWNLVQSAHELADRVIASEMHPGKQRRFWFRGQGQSPPRFPPKPLQARRLHPHQAHRNEGRIQRTGQRM